MGGYTFAGHCKGITEAGTRCQHSVVFANGYCRQHGGDSTEFLRARLARFKAKALRRHARWRKRMEAGRGRTP